MHLKLSASLQIFAAVIYVLGLAAFAQFFIYPQVHDAWIGALVQIFFYVLLALPFVFVRPRLLRLFRGTRPQVVFGVILILAAIIFAIVIDHQPAPHIINNFVRQVFTGPIEELIFRGFIWEQSLQLTKNYLAVGAINIICFFAIHIPYAVAEHQDWTFCAGVLVFAGIMCLIRLKTKNLVLGSLTHIAVNLS